MAGIDGAGDAAPDAAETQGGTPPGTGVPQGAGAPPAFLCYTVGRPTADPTGCDAVVVAGSVQPVFVPVALTDAASGAALDPTGLDVACAFTDGADPGEGDFAAAAWLTAGGGHFAGVGVAAVVAGSYAVFLRTGGFIGFAGILRVR